MRRGRRFGVVTVLSMAFVAGLALAAFTSQPGGEALADDAQLELVSVDTGGGETQSCVGTVAADGTCVGQPDATHVASATVDELGTPKVKKSSCSRAAN